MTEIPFSFWNNRYPVSPCWIIGRGLTRFDYKELEGISDPIIFINDAVHLEQHVPHAHSFFFASDKPVADAWIEHVRSVYVWHCWERVNFGVCRRITKASHVNHPSEALLCQTRDEMAASKKLYHNGGTVHPVLHWAWYLGCRGCYMVGCDGLNLGYDPRIPQRHKNKPGGVFGQIRRRQDEIAEKLGLQLVYIGTPPCPTPCPTSPQSDTSSAAAK